MLHENVKDLKAKGSIRFSCGISSPLYTCTKFSMAFGTLDLLTHVTETCPKSNAAQNLQICKMFDSFFPICIFFRKDYMDSCSPNRPPSGCSPDWSGKLQVLMIENNCPQHPRSPGDWKRCSNNSAFQTSSFLH